MLRFSLSVAFVILFSLNSCNSKSSEKTTGENPRIENENEILSDKKVVDPDTADENYSKRITSRRRLEFPEVY